MRRRGPCALLALLALATAPGALAGPPTLPAHPAPGSVGQFACPTKPISTADLEACAAKQLLAADREFNKATAGLWPLLDGTARAELARAQKAWLTYREQECTAEARVFLGGTLLPVEFAGCEVELTTARVKDLRDALAVYCQGRTRIGPARGCPRR